MKQYYVYILASKANGTLYTGITNDLRKRVLEHENNTREGFTSKYSVHRLVYFEKHNNIEKAIAREKQIKIWKRQWKVELIERYNPLWKDLFKNKCACNEFYEKQRLASAEQPMDSKSSLE